MLDIKPALPFSGIAAKIVMAARLWRKLSAAVRPAVIQALSAFDWRQDKSTVGYNLDHICPYGQSKPFSFILTTVISLCLFLSKLV
ncbi:MAG: hypothetical protein ACLUDH_16000 [Faecalispora sporosphaeroides]|uniref:hypothetical protein n=1 Tax=Faecalispora sporosphaeroides TaxID=1549 RepID=UPI0039950A5C